MAATSNSVQRRQCQLIRLDNSSQHTLSRHFNTTTKRLNPTITGSIKSSSSRRKRHDNAANVRSVGRMCQSYKQRDVSCCRSFAGETKARVESSSSHNMILGFGAGLMATVEAAQRIKTSLFSLLLALIIIISIAASSASALPGNKTQAHQQQPIETGATNAYGEPIKWSFGGWAPLNGKLPPNASSSATSPLPPQQHRPTTSAPRVGRQQPVESLKESASMSHAEHVHFQQPNQYGSGSGSEQQHQMKLMTGPAYEMPMQRPQQFSPPAPTPIIRGHLLGPHQPVHRQANNLHNQQRYPAASNQFQLNRPAYGLPQASQVMQQLQQYPQQRPPYHQQQQHSMPQQQHMHPMQLAEIHRQQQQKQQNFHQQQMRHQQMKHELMHQQLMQQQQQQQQHQHQYRPPAMQQNYPRQQVPANQAQRYQHQPVQVQIPTGRQQEAVPHVGAYKVIEGEQPVIFSTPSLPSGPQDGRMPVLEVNGRANNTYSGEHAKQQQQVAANSQPTDKTNYHQQQVASDNNSYQMVGGEPAQSNNIQDIKQKQMYAEHQQQQQTQSAENTELSQADKVKSSYLTIPVAVETEGDKVLTADDINEIEKHVINVLPNMKTADKIVKMADAHLALAPVTIQQQQQQQAHGPSMSAGEQQQQQQQNGISEPELHQVHYDEHRNTMKQLEVDLKEQPQQQLTNDYHTSTTPQQQQQVEKHNTASGSSYGPASPTTVSLMATAVADQGTTSKENAPSSQQQELHVVEPQYFVATGPAQELGTFDPDQIGDYNLIKNDLLNNFRYEPTRAQPAGARQQQQTASTQPMPYSPQPTNQHQHRQQTSPASVTRYFQQGQAHSQRQQQQQQQQQQRGRGLFGRLNGGYGRQQQQYPSTAGPSSAGATKTLGGRRVSEVMRPLIHTTPVPMTSPVHVPSVEPEKVDAIQLIAGQANDKRPMVVEAHQLVNHTPDGGIDYNSGMGSQGAQQQQQQHHANNNDNHNNSTTQHNGAHYQQQESNNNHQQPDQQGAIIEYVAINEQALNNAVNQQPRPQPQSQSQQNYEIAGQQEVQPIYVSNGESQQQQPATRQSYNAGNDYTMQQTTSTTQAHLGSHGSNDQQQLVEEQQQQHSPTPPTTYLVDGQQSIAPNHQPEAGSLAAWSPSVASEHQQSQQMELSEHVAQGPMQQMDMPATAGYNFFNQQQEQPTASSGQPPVQQEYEQQQQEQATSTTKASGGRWRTKAGGSQPNPDAQYDGQIAVGTQESSQENNGDQHEQQQADNYEDNNRGQQYSNYGNQQQQTSVELTRTPQASDPRPNQGEEQHHRQQQVNDNGSGEASADEYQQQQQQQQNSYHEHGTATTPAGANDATQQQQTSGDSYVTNSFVGGAQMNHRPGGGSGSYDKQQPQYGYMRLDRERQQSHLAKHQAQHQARLADLMNQQQNYQTTTPMSLTTLPTVEQQAEVIQQQQQQQQVADEQQPETAQQQQQQNGGYMVEQVQSRPSVQSSPEAMLVNDVPLQYPILDQQSLISDDANQNNANTEYASGDQRLASAKQPAGVYQVYQAYYAPKDHKPLPGYVRLSLAEFHDLFRDAEIQYVDKNMNGVNNLVDNNDDGNQQQQQQPLESVDGSYDRQNELMGAASTEQQSILVDRRSISERRSGNSTLDGNETLIGEGKQTKKFKIGQVVKKIISISRNSTNKTVNKPVATHKTSSTLVVSPAQSQSSKDASGKSVKQGQLSAQKKKAEAPMKKPTTNTHQQQAQHQSKVFNESSITHKQS